ncbi:GNAT family N-acetyltransferase [Caloranaerobacter ferrireducens]|uniref:GNAT family N-acetyltransferase n=1 Tax=Caloranaerobacter ferrireducens TaxID=1323370 RepID=UPI00084D7DBE|nr:GNAT family N-acetyltransferase [Caloranaerobacter ferrireducens]
MIRLLNNEDYDILMEYIKKEKELNLFIIGDVENYGFNNEFQKLWGEFNQKGELIGVLLKYFESFIFYSRDEFDVEGFYNIMKNEEFKLLSGEKSIVEKFEKLHSFSKKRDTYFCKLDKGSKLEENELLANVRKVELENVDEIVKLYKLIEEFSRDISEESIRKKFEDNTGRGYYIEEDGKMVSVAQTTAENSTSAMIVGVCTHPDYRKRGYATACMTKLCKALLNEGKSLCLFYDNPKAGRIYKRLGFKDMGIWTMYNK